MMMSPLNMFANGFDGFFNDGGNDAYDNRGVDNHGITIEGMHSESPTDAPLGSGLLVMVAAGIGYATMRRSRKAKSNSSIIMLLTVVLLLGMTQCRKKVVETAESGTVLMTVSTGGDRVVFNPEILGFNWNATGNEYVVVSGNYSGYLGELTASSNGGCAVTQRKEFRGMITAPSAKDTELYFFYLGNGSHSQVAGTESVVIDFSNQVNEDVSTVTDYLIATEHISIDDVEIENDQYRVKIDLRVKTAIAYFKLSGFVGASTLDEEVYLHGSDLYSSAEINFKTGEVIGKDKGFINVGANNEKGFYVSLIGSGTTGPTTLCFDSNSKSGSIEFSDGIKENVFYSDELNSEFTPLSIEAAMSLPDDVLPGLFSVSPTKKVRFSKGNLKYSRTSLNDDWSTGTWSFMENQYGYEASGNTGDDYCNRTSISFFGWGTTGKKDRDYNENEICFMPNKTVIYEKPDPNNWSTWIDQTEFYGPTGTYDLSVERYSDWGYCMGGESSPWRTLSNVEFAYLLGFKQEEPFREASTVCGVDNARYTKAKINGMYGVVIFPDEYNQPSNIQLDCINYSKSNLPFNNSFVNTLSLDDWALMEAEGAVFLPAAGQRFLDFDTYLVTDVVEVGVGGGYWTTTAMNDGSACEFIFDGGFLTFYHDVRALGHSVRLVYDHK